MLKPWEAKSEMKPLTLDEVQGRMSHAMKMDETWLSDAQIATACIMTSKAYVVQIHGDRKQVESTYYCCGWGKGLVQPVVGMSLCYPRAGIHESAIESAMPFAGIQLETTIKKREF